MSHSTSIEIGADVNPNPRVSIIIPAYNISDYIAESLGSVFAQTYPDYEAIVINDGSTDSEELESAIEPFKERIIYISQINQGASSARNSGIKVARGEVIAFLDGDDFWLPNFLESQIQFLDQNNLDMAYADAQFFGENVTKYETYMQFSKSNGAVTPESLLAWDCNVITSGTVVRKAKLLEVGLFDESEVWRRAQDYEMWFRLAKHNTKIGYQREVLLKYRIRIDSLSGDDVEHAKRNIDSLEGIINKYTLSPAEQIIWERQMARSKAMWQIESGKAALFRSDYQSARENFLAANRFYRKPKLKFVTLMLRFTPGAMRYIFLKYDSNNNYRRLKQA